MIDVTANGLGQTPTPPTPAVARLPAEAIGREFDLPRRLVRPVKVHFEDRDLHFPVPVDAAEIEEFPLVRAADLKLGWRYVPPVFVPREGAKSAGLEEGGFLDAIR